MADEEAIASIEQGSSCHEVAHAWRKSSHCGSEGDARVEGSPPPSGRPPRDSKNPTGPTLTLALAPTAWASFTSYVSN